MMYAAGWETDFGGQRRFVRQADMGPASRRCGWQATGHAAHRWLLLGQQHRAAAHAQWAVARVGPGWTLAVEASVRWLAGEECTLTASSVAPC